MQILEKPKEPPCVECIQKGLYSYFAPETTKVKVLNKSESRVSESKVLIKSKPKIPESRVLIVQNLKLIIIQGLKLLNQKS